MRTVLLGLVASLALADTFAWADPPIVDGTPQVQTSDAQRRQQNVAEIQRLMEEANRLQSASRLTEAIAAGEKAAGLAREVHGDVSEGAASLLAWLAPFYESREDWPAVRKAREEALTIRRALYGEKDWRVTDARLARQDVDARMRLTPEARRELAETDQLTSRARAMRQIVEQGGGILLATLALETRRRILGPEHPQVASSLNDIGVLYGSLNQETKAESFYKQALEIRKKVLGDDHPDTALCFQNWASVKEARGDLAEAEIHCLEALKIRTKTLGVRHGLTAQSFDHLVSLRGKLVAQNLGRADFASARRIQGDLIPLLAQRYGERNWRVTDARLGLGEIELREQLSPEARAQLTIAEEQDREVRRLFDQRRFREALVPAERALAIRQKLQGKEHRDTARILNELGAIYFKLNENDKVESLARQTLAIHRQLLGEEHPDTALMLNNLAKVFEAQGNDAKAEPFYYRSLAVWTKVLGSRHADTLATEESLTSLEERLVGRNLADGNYAQARKIQDDLVHLLTARYGEHNWRVTDSRLKRSDIDFEEGLSPEARAQLKEAERHNEERRDLDAQGRNRDALAQAEQTLEILKTIRGPMHPATAATLNLAAVLKDRLDEHAQAVTLYQQALEIRQRVLGERHPDTVQCLRNLGESYSAREEFEKAEPLLRRVLEIQQNIQGEQASETVDAWDRLIALHTRMVNHFLGKSDYAAAERIQSETVRLLARRYGEQDWHVTDARLNLQEIALEEKLSPDGRAQLKHVEELGAVRRRLFEQGRYQEAVVPEEQALEIRKKLLGEEHPATANSLNNVAVVYERLHADAKVEPLYRQALQIRKKVLGELHPQTATSLENLASFYDGRGQLDQAVALYRQALAIRQRVLGEKDQSTIATFNNLVAVYRKKANKQADAADFAAARQGQIETIRMLVRRYGDKNWQVTDARLKLRDVELKQRLTPEARAELKKAEDLDAEHVRLFEQERYPESLVPAQEALAIRKRVLGEEHPDTTTSLNFIGLLYEKLKDFAKAEPFYRQALEIRKKILGDEHPDTALLLNNLAVLCQKRGDNAQAELLYLQAVEIQMRVLGKEHNRTIGTFNDLVSLQPKMVTSCLASGDYGTAKRIQEDLVRVFVTQYGPNDRRVADARLRLSDIEARAALSPEAHAQLNKAEERDIEGRGLFENGRYREAIVPVREVMELRMKTLGPKHADTLMSLKNLELIERRAIAECLNHDDYETAGQIVVDLGRLLAERYGDKDWHVIDARLKRRDFDLRQRLSAEARGSLKLAVERERESLRLSDKHQYREALGRAEEALALRRKVLGDENLETVKNLNYVGVLHSRLQENAIAESHYRQVLDRTRKALGEQHPDTALCLSNLGRICELKEDVATALPLYKETLTIRKQVLGEASIDTRETYDDLARLQRRIADRHLAQGDYASARRVVNESVALLRQHYGEKDWRVTDARLRQTDIDLQERLSPEARTELKRADEQETDAFQKFQKREWATGVVSATESLEIRKKILGIEHRDTARAYATLGTMLGFLGDHSAARANYEQSLAIRRKLLGEEHDETAASYAALALELQDFGDFAAAIHHAERALEIRRRIKGEEDSETAFSYVTLGDLFLATSNCTAARSHFERALAIQRKMKGEDDPDTVSSYSRLGGASLALGDYAAARRNFERALAILGKLRSEENVQSAGLYCSLGSLSSRTGDYAAARSNYERALAISRKLDGEECVGVATACGGLSNVFRGLGDLQAARTNSERMLAIDRKIFGDQHPNTATAHDGLAVVLHDLGDFAAARSNYERALAIDRKCFGEEHRTTAVLHNNLGLLCLDQGDFPSALSELEQALATTQSFQARMFGALSEDQQLALQDEVRISLDTYLTVAGEANADDSAVYAWVLKCKGAVTAEQFLIHLQRRKSGVAKLFDELQAVSTRLSALDSELSHLSTSSSDPKLGEQRLQEIQRQIQQLNARNESLQQQLVSKNSEFRQAKESALLRPDGIQKALPPKSALIDFVEYSHYPRATAGTGKRASERRLLAFVIRPERSIQKIDLGSADAVASKIDAWKREVVESRQSNGAEIREELRKLIWNPLAPHLDHAETVLISPDGSLCQFPFAVLPGAKPGSYLLEECRVAVIPVPRLLPQLLAQSYAAPESGADTTPLLIGNVDYESDPGTILLAKSDVRDRSRSREPVGNRAGNRIEFKYLPGTKEEMEAIDQLYRHNFPGHELHMLSGLDATEQAFRDKAPRHRWVHLATHGYFLPPPITDRDKPVEDLVGTRQEMRTSHPGLWSGIALAGANGRPEAESNSAATKSGTPRDDGKLTALEVEGLDLMDVDLIVLSACQTALGRLAGGEGMLGLQRAFQLAGAKTAVTSLWTVDDTATRVLMTEFYKNLWEKKLPKLEALRQAQLRMLRDYDPSERKLISRGLDIPETAPVRHERGSPYFWAPFVLSGDWR